MRSRSSRGFTLIELTVSMTIMAMIMTVAFAAFRIGLNTWERGTKVAERLERRSVIERLIRRQLPLAMPGVVFEGTRDHLEFVADYSLIDGPGDFRKIDYVGEQGRFLYRDQPVAAYLPGEPSAAPATMLGELKTVSFEFLQTDSQQRSTWVEEWKSGAGVPPAVRVHLDSDTFIVRMVNRK